MYKYNINQHMLAANIPSNFSHFAALYDTLSVEENWDSKNGLPEPEGIAATNLIDAFPDKVTAIFASGKAEAWKVCVGKIHERIRKEREAQYLRDAKKQTNCVKSIADDFISNGALGEVEDFRKCFYKI
nr:unnamed protein product [Callosobruchus chinensis]